MPILNPIKTYIPLNLIEWELFDAIAWFFVNLFQPRIFPLFKYYQEIQNMKTAAAAVRGHNNYFTSRMCYVIEK